MLISYGNILNIPSLQTALDAPSLVFLPPAGTCSLRPSLAATLRAAVAVQIVCPADLSLNRSYSYTFGPRIKYGTGSGTRWRQKSCAIIASPGEKSGLASIVAFFLSMGQLSDLGTPHLFSKSVSLCRGPRAVIRN